MFAQVEVVSRLAALLAIGLVPTAVAHADTQDDKYLAALAAQGITGDPGQLIADGHAACDNYGNPGLVAQMSGLEARGMSNIQASNVLIDGVRAYCPEKSPWGPLG
jgi:hypothetical protein